jgi:hypothetical protein
VAVATPSPRPSHYVIPSPSGSIDPNNPILHPKKADLTISGDVQGNYPVFTVDQCGPGGSSWVISASSAGPTNSGVFLSFSIAGYHGSGTYEISHPGSEAEAIVVGKTDIDVGATSGTVTLGANGESVTFNTTKFSQHLSAGKDGTLIFNGAISCTTPAD